MKKIFLLSILILCTINPLHAATGGSTSVTLQPSLVLQMHRNTAITNANIKSQRIQKAQEKIRENKARLTARKTTIKKTQTGIVRRDISPSPPDKSPKPSPTVPNIQMHITPYEESPRNTDISRIRMTWLGWTNTVRNELGLSPFTLDPRLNATATEWSGFSRDRGYIIHGRPGSKCVGAGNYHCYDFAAIDTWFKLRGIDPIVIHRAKHTENIGYGSYHCTTNDCTDAVIHAIRKTFDYYMSEKGTAYDPHYRSIIQPNFSKIGIGVVIDESKNIYYLTVHYITI